MNEITINPNWERLTGLVNLDEDREYELREFQYYIQLVTNGRIIQAIDDYLSGKADAQQTSDVALKMFKSRQFDSYSENEQQAILALFDLHDINEKGATGVPTKDELKKIRDELRFK